MSNVLRKQEFSNIDYILKTKTYTKEVKTVSEHEELTTFTVRYHTLFDDHYKFSRTFQTRSRIFDNELNEFVYSKPKHDTYYLDILQKSLNLKFGDKIEMYTIWGWVTKPNKHQEMVYIKNLCYSKDLNYEDLDGYTLLNASNIVDINNLDFDHEYKFVTINNRLYIAVPIDSDLGKFCGSRTVLDYHKSNYLYTSSMYLRNHYYEPNTSKICEYILKEGYSPPEYDIIFERIKNHVNGFKLPWYEVESLKI